jgi:PAS domain S-box-containing protein
MNQRGNDMPALDKLVPERNWNAAYSGLPVGILIFDETGALRYANRAAGTVGIMLSRADGQDAPFAGLWHVTNERAASPRNLESPVDTVRRTGRACNETIAVDGPAHDLRVFKIDAAPVKADNRAAPWVLAICTDVTERWAADARDRVSAKFGSDLVAVISGDGRYLYANAAHLSVLGYAPDYLVGKSAFDLLPESDRDDARARLSRIVGEKGQSERLQSLRFLHADGTIRTLESTISNCLDEPGIGGVIVSGRDITERTKIETALTLSERRFETLVESSPVAICLTDAAGTFVLVNDAFCLLSGYSRGALIGRNFTMLVPHADRVAMSYEYASRFRQDPPDNTILDTELMAADGHIANVLLSSSYAPDMSGSMQRMTILLNVTEGEAAQLAADRARLAAEEVASVREQQAEQAEALAAVSEALATTLDPTRLYGVILDHAARVLGSDHAVVLKREDGWVTVVANWGEPYAAPGSHLFPVTIMSSFWKDLEFGRPVLVRDTAEDPTWQDIPPWVGPHRVRSLISIPLIIDSDLVATFEVDSFVPNFYTEQHVRLATLLGERVGQALRNARLYAAEQERARAAEELNNLRDDLVAAVSHELRTPLTVISGFAELLESRWRETSEEKRLNALHRIRAATKRQQRLVEDLLLLIQPEGMPLDLRTGMVEVGGLVQHALDEVLANYPGQKIEIKGEDELRVHVDPERAAQILVSLLDNAAKYSPSGSLVSVSWATAKTSVRIRVRDRGPGISPEGQANLFTRFGRMSDSWVRAGRVGTGLGLYIGRRLAREMGGDLSLESTGVDGSTFLVNLRLAHES